MAFRHISDFAKEAESYIDKRRKLEIQSCKTGFKKLDQNLLGGIEWGSVISIGGRPSVGKTAFSSCLIRGILENNNLEEIEIVDFIWEMSGRTMIIRDLSAETKTSYGDIISAEADNGKTVSDEQMEIFKKVFEKYSKYPWYLEEEPKTTKQLDDIIKRRIEANPKKRRVWRFDHSILAKQGADEMSQVTMLQNLLNVCVKYKKGGNDIFLVLTQLGRDFEARQEDGSDKAFPLQGDCFGGDAVAQSSETLILLNRPAKYGITYYGKRPNGVQIEFPDTIFAHIVKSRNSAPDIVLRYRARFEHMKMIEL